MEKMRKSHAIRPKWEASRTAFVEAAPPNPKSHKIRLASPGDLIFAKSNQIQTNPKKIHQMKKPLPILFLLVAGTFARSAPPAMAPSPADNGSVEAAKFDGNEPFNDHKLFGNYGNPAEAGEMEEKENLRPSLRGGSMAARENEDVQLNESNLKPESKLGDEVLEKGYQANDQKGVRGAPMAASGNEDFEHLNEPDLKQGAKLGKVQEGSGQKGDYGMYEPELKQDVKLGEDFHKGRGQKVEEEYEGMDGPREARMFGKEVGEVNESTGEKPEENEQMAEQPMEGNEAEISKNEDYKLQKENSQENGQNVEKAEEAATVDEKFLQIYPFLKNAPTDAVAKFHEILRDHGLSKREVAKKQREWAEAQADDIAQAFTQWKQHLEEKKQAKIGKIEKNLATFKPQIRKMYGEVKSMLDNQDMTRHQECEQIRVILNGVDQPVREEFMDKVRLRVIKFCMEEEEPQQQSNNENHEELPQENGGIPAEGGNNGELPISDGSDDLEQNQPPHLHFESQHVPFEHNKMKYLEQPENTAEQQPIEGGQNEEALAGNASGNEKQPESEAAAEEMAEGDQEPVSEVGQVQQKGKQTEQQQEGMEKQAGNKQPRRNVIKASMK